MNERLVGGIIMKNVAWRVLTLVIVFLGLIGFAEFASNFLLRFVYFVGLGVIAPTLYIILWFARWVVVIGGIIYFYRKTK